MTKIIKEEKSGRGGQEGRMKRREEKSNNYYHSCLSTGYMQQAEKRMGGNGVDLWRIPSKVVPTDTGSM